MSTNNPFSKINRWAIPGPLFFMHGLQYAEIATWNIKVYKRVFKLAYRFSAKGFSQISIIWTCRQGFNEWTTLSRGNHWMFGPWFLISSSEWSRFELSNVANFWAQNVHPLPSLTDEMFQTTYQAKWNLLTNGQTNNDGPRPRRLITHGK